MESDVAYDRRRSDDDSLTAMREFLTVEENLRCAMRFFGEATGTGEVRALDRTVAGTRNDIDRAA